MWRPRSDLSLLGESNLKESLGVVNFDSGRERIRERERERVICKIDSRRRQQQVEREQARTHTLIAEVGDSSLA